MAEITDAQVAGLRAFLTGDEDEWNRLFSGPHPVDQQPGFAILCAAAFCAALEARFQADRSTAAIVRFVASARARYGKRADDLDPRAAEHLVRAVLGGEPSDLDDSARAAQVPLLRHLVVSEQFDGPSLDAFLARARVQAGQV